jgi:hypothetical protein
LWSVGDEPPDAPSGATASDISERDAATLGDAASRPVSSDSELAGGDDLPIGPADVPVEEDYPSSAWAADIDEDNPDFDLWDSAPFATTTGGRSP